MLDERYRAVECITCGGSIPPEEVAGQLPNGGYYHLSSSEAGCGKPGPGAYR